MICRYHLRQLEPQPPSRISFESELRETKRTILKCPVASCSVVGIDFDVVRIDAAKCYKCGGPLGAQTDDGSLTVKNCLACKKKYQKKYRDKMRKLGRARDKARRRKYV